jgi:hypothetical protein
MVGMQNTYAQNIDVPGYKISTSSTKFFMVERLSPSKTARTSVVRLVRRVLVVCSCVLACLFASNAVLGRPESRTAIQPAPISEVEQGRILLTNVLDQEERHYPVVLLYGTALSAKIITITDQENRGVNGTVSAPVILSRFKILVELAPGENHLRLKTESGEKTICVKYTPCNGDHLINVVYLTADDCDTHYVTQKPNDPQNYEDKLDTAVKLMQCFTAERMHDAGKGYKTFALDLNANGRVKVKVLKFPESKEALRKLSGNDLYQRIYSWLVPLYPSDRFKNMVVMSFTGYDNVRKKPLAHTALGAGGMGLFSCNGMCAWPDNLPDVVPAFSNATPVDDTLIWDDTNGRSTLWALASTTIGAVLHELGHTFGLEHQMFDPMSIMSRGFDYFDREFILQEPPARGHSEDVQVTDSSTAHWDTASAAKLTDSPWFR